MINRRRFIKQVSAAGMLSSIPIVFLPQQNGLILQQKSTQPKIWACLLHLSVNMWREYYPDLEFDESLWNDALKKMVDAGMNMVVIDLGDGVKYESHPEIAVNNAWATTRLHDELVKIRKMGLEPIPKMNFSTCHDGWLGEYGRMVSTKQYYIVCRDLIAEVIDLFDTPRFFHLGMDEENESNQRDFGMIIIRQNELYWGDLYFLIGEVFKGGSRPWVWQDYIRYYPEQFARMMPKSVLQSNWYNLTDFDKPKTNKSVKAYLDLETLGYDQVPGGSNYYENTEKCFFNNVKFCYENIADQRLFGFIQSPWKHTIEENRERILLSIEQAGEAKKWFDDKHQ
jgi:hypothetical protein